MRISKYILKQDWLLFEQKCYETDLNVLDKAVKILGFGASFYNTMRVFENVRGHGVDFNKFARARSIVEKVITCKIERKLRENAKECASA